MDAVILFSNAHEHVLEKAIKIQHATEKFKNRHDAKRLNSKICEGLMIWHERARNLVVAGV